MPWLNYHVDLTAFTDEWVAITLDVIKGGFFKDLIDERKVEYDGSYDGTYTTESRGWRFVTDLVTDYYTWCPSFVAFKGRMVVALSNDCIKATSRQHLHKFLADHGDRITTFDKGNI